MGHVGDTFILPLYFITGAYNYMLTQYVHGAESSLRSQSVVI